MNAQRRARPTEQHDATGSQDAAERVIRPRWQREESDDRRLAEALEQVGVELASYRNRLSPASGSGEIDPRVTARLDTLDREMELLRQTLAELTQLRDDTDVQAAAIGQLTGLLELLAERQDAIQVEPLVEQIAALEQQQRKSAREQAAALMMLGIGLAPGFGALAWLVLRG